jgi:hypothetical protein
VKLLASKWLKIFSNVDVIGALKFCDFTAQWGCLRNLLIRNCRHEKRGVRSSEKSDHFFILKVLQKLIFLKVCFFFV